MHYLQKLFAWIIHLFTASGILVGLLTIHYIYEGKPVIALNFMALAILIDAFDGTLARLVHSKKVLPNIDGALLDNMVDFLNYVVVPCVFLMKGFISFSTVTTWLVVSLISVSSAYQFTQADAKTSDHFFKGFPCYWNIAVFYLFISHCSATLSAFILIFLSILVFVPIKYVYPSRLDYLSESKGIKYLMQVGVGLYALASLALLALYPKLPTFLIFYSVIFIIFYMMMSVYRTFIRLSSVIND